MKALIGIAMVALGIPIAWWGLNKAVAGQDSFNWLWVIALLVAALGVITLIARFRHWMDS